MMGEGEDDSGSLDSDSDLILDGENAVGAGAGKVISYHMKRITKYASTIIVESF